MRTIIAGSRNIADIAYVREAMNKCGWTPCYVVSGAARGVDTLGELWARENNLPYLRFRADWENEGKRAGHLRNIKMAHNADALVAVWDGVSKGTADMIKIAKSNGLTVYVHYVKL